MKYFNKIAISILIFFICLKLEGQTYIPNLISGPTCILDTSTQNQYAVNLPSVSFAYDYYYVIFYFDASSGTIIQNAANPSSNTAIVKWSNPGTLGCRIEYYQIQQTGNDDYGWPVYEPVLVESNYSTLDVYPSGSFYYQYNVIFSEVTTGVYYPLINSLYNLQLVSYQYDYSTTPIPLKPVFPLPLTISNHCTPSYQWESSESFDENSFTAIAGATNAELSFSQPLQKTMYFRRRLISDNGLLQSFYSYSNIIKLSVVSTSWENLNYIKEITIQTKGITTKSQIDLLPLGIGGKSQTTKYFDDFDRPIQTINVETATPDNGSTLWGDIVSFNKYDEFGRLAKTYLPYSTSTDIGKFKINNEVEQSQFYLNNYNENYSFHEATFDNSPFNRVTNNKEAGTNYHNSSGTSSSFTFNDILDDVKIFTVGFNSGDMPQLVTYLDDNGTSVSYYRKNTLTKQITTNSDNKQVVQFVNSLGQVILSKVQKDNNPINVYDGWICTYNVYDDFGRLRYILSPEAVNQLVLNNWSQLNNQDFLDGQCFKYEYDAKGRNTLKKAPGAKELYLLYDSRDRLVFTQDGNQRGKSPQEWTATLYDELDRSIMSVLYTPNKTKNDLILDLGKAITSTDVTMNLPGQPVQNLTVDHHISTNHYYTAQNSIEFVADAGGNFETNTGDIFVAEITTTAVTPGYTVLRTTLNSPISPADLNDASKTTILKYFFYDNYNYNSVKSFSSNFDNTIAYSTTDVNVLPIAKTNRILNMVTGSMVRVVGTNTFLTTTLYYDEDGQLIQTLSDNIKNGVDIVTNQYHFDGRLLSVSEKHSANLTGYNNYSILSKYHFDKIGRVKSIEKAYGTISFPAKTVVSYDYDALGNLKTKHLSPGYNNTTTGKNELESLTYSHDVKGHITGINKDYALKKVGVYNKWSNYFGMCLGFDNNENIFSKTNLLSKVSGIAWTTQGDDAQRKYEFTYDNVGRLEKAEFNEKQSISDSWNHAKRDFSVSGRNGKIEYDLNGNILFMKHMGVAPGISGPLVVDDLAYSYVNSLGVNTYNKLAKVTDAATSVLNGSFGDFKDGTNIGDDYIYDDNGNLLVDLNKSVKDLSSGGQSTSLGTSGIKYNFLDKPEEINIAGKGKIKIVYDADGNKLQRIYTPQGSTTSKTTSYINQFVYEDNNLQYISFEEGRIRAIQSTSQNNGYDFLTIDGSMNLPANKRGVFDYYIKDYLGNVRMILTEETHIGGNACTMETNRAANEEPVFGQVDNSGNVNTATNEVYKTRFATANIPGQSVGAGWQSNTSAYVSKLGKLAASKIGPNTILRVMAGDEVSATSQYYYQQAANNTGSGGSQLFSSLIYSLTQTISNSPIVSNAIKGQASNVTNLLSSGDITPIIAPNENTGDNKALAYLTVLFFDEQFNFIAENSTPQRVGSAGEGAIYATAIKAPKNGYAYVYLSNESDENVYFDNFQVTQNHARIIEENHYYAYGLKITAISSRKLPNPNEGGIENTFLYNDKEFWDEADLNWYDYGFRNYDPQIGRFVQLDPLTFDYPYLTNYQYASCNPINNIDVDGLEGYDVTVYATISSRPSMISTLYILSKTIEYSYTPLYRYNALGTNGSFTCNKDLGYQYTDNNPETNTGVVYQRQGLELDERIKDVKITYTAQPVSSGNVSTSGSQLSQTKLITPYEAALNAANLRNARLNAGLDPETGRRRFEYTIHWDKANENLVKPMVEGAITEVGVGAAFKGFSYIGSTVAKKVGSAAVEEAGTFYRAMSNAEYAALESSGGLSHMPGKELFVSSSAKYSRAYLQKSGYDVLIRFNMKPGAMNYFKQVGVMHRTAAGARGWAGRGSLLWKSEQGVMNLGIQSNTHMFNSWINSFKVIN